MNGVAVQVIRLISDWTGRRTVSRYKDMQAVIPVDLFFSPDPRKSFSSLGSSSHKRPPHSSRESDKVVVPFEGGRHERDNLDEIDLYSVGMTCFRATRTYTIEHIIHPFMTVA